MRCSNDSVGPKAVVTVEQFGGAKIDEEDLASVINDWVLGLDVTVDDVFGVQVLDCKDDGADIKPGCWLIEQADLSNSFEHLYAMDVFEKKV